MKLQENPKSKNFWKMSPCIKRTGTKVHGRPQSGVKIYLAPNNVTFIGLWWENDVIQAAYVYVVPLALVRRYLPSWRTTLNFETKTTSSLPMTPILRSSFIKVPFNSSYLGAIRCYASRSWQPVKRLHFIGLAKKKLQSYVQEFN